MRRKQRTLETLFAWLEAQSVGQPLLVVIEDVQWVDPTTLEFLGRYFGSEPVPRLMLLLTHRADFVPPWGHRAHVRHLALDRLGRDAMHAMVVELTGGRALPAELEAQIGARTDGVPLFVEEITHAVLESGWIEEASSGLVTSASLPERLVPSTLRESLLARLDGLGEARAVAQVLSVVGREAPFELLRAVSELDDSELKAGLDRLVDRDLVRRRHSPAGTNYVLKHWLVQDVAYESLLRSSRRRYHGRVAAALPPSCPRSSRPSRSSSPTISWRPRRTATRSPTSGARASLRTTARRAPRRSGTWAARSSLRWRSPTRRSGSGSS